MIITDPQKIADHEKAISDAIGKYGLSFKYSFTKPSSCEDYDLAKAYRLENSSRFQIKDKTLTDRKQEIILRNGNITDTKISNFFGISLLFDNITFESVSFNGNSEFSGVLFNNCVFQKNCQLESVLKDVWFVQCKFEDSEFKKNDKTQNLCFYNCELDDMKIPADDPKIEIYEGPFGGKLPPYNLSYPSESDQFSNGIEQSEKHEKEGEDDTLKMELDRRKPTSPATPDTVAGQPSSERKKKESLGDVRLEDGGFYQYALVTSDNFKYSKKYKDIVFSDVDISVFESLSNVEFNNCDFTHVKYSGQYSNIKFNECTFTSVQFSESTTLECKFNQCKFEDITIKQPLIKCLFKDCEFDHIPNTSLLSFCKFEGSYENVGQSIEESEIKNHELEDIINYSLDAMISHTAGDRKNMLVDIKKKLRQFSNNMVIDRDPVKDFKEFVQQDLNQDQLIEMFEILIKILKEKVSGK